jgi:hypothetical protein
MSKIIVFEPVLGRIPLVKLVFVRVYGVLFQIMDI